MIRDKRTAEEFVADLWFDEVFTWSENETEEWTPYGICYWELVKTGYGYKLSKWIPGVSDGNSELINWDECVRFVYRHRKGINEQLEREGFGCYL